MNRTVTEPDWETFDYNVKRHGKSAALSAFASMLRIRGIYTSERMAAARARSEKVQP